MGNAGGRCRPTQRRPQPMATVPVAREVAVPPGGTAIASWDFRGGLGIEIEIQNVGTAPCEFAGHTLRAGKSALVSVRDGAHEFALAITSARGTRILLALAAWRAPAPPTRTLGTRKIITRDPKTHTISSIVEEPIWIEHAAEGR